MNGWLKHLRKNIKMKTIKILEKFIKSAFLIKEEELSHEQLKIRKDQLNKMYDVFTEKWHDDIISFFNNEGFNNEGFNNEGFNDVIISDALLDAAKDNINISHLALNMDIQKGLDSLSMGKKINGQIAYKELQKKLQTKFNTDVPGNNE